MKPVLLGPIIGHTTDRSTRVWIRVRDDPRLYDLLIHGHGLAPFVSTEGVVREFGTAMSIVSGLEPDRQYRYHVTRRGRTVVGTAGTVRTMPPPRSNADMLFVTLSCSSLLHLDG